MSGERCMVLDIKGSYSCDQHLSYQIHVLPVCEPVLGGAMPYAFKRGTQVCND